MSEISYEVGKPSAELRIFIEKQLTVYIVLVSPLINLHCGINPLTEKYNGLKGM